MAFATITLVLIAPAIRLVAPPLCGLQSDAGSRLNGTVQGVLTREDDSLVAMHALPSRKGAPA
ncbi:MAG TPA: hypothetical protein VE011_00965 [Candidatus Dormibacteraeota bacterium]|nr:hypothetical protein [Candidatus Dormibacteraeota bacterium]